MSGPRFPVTISLNLDERARLDAFAHHHGMNRSMAVRTLLMHARLPGQTRLPLEDEAAAEVLDPAVDLVAGPAHAKHCTDDVRKAWGRSNPFGKEPCRVCWPRLPTRDEADRALAIWRTGALGPVPRGVVGQSNTPGWAAWAHVELDMAVGTPLVKGQRPPGRDE